MSDAIRRGPPALSESPEPDEKSDPQMPESDATLAKQEKMDVDRANRTGPAGPVVQTMDNALAGAGVLAKQKAQARKGRR